MVCVISCIRYNSFCNALISDLYLDIQIIYGAVGKLGPFHVTAQ